MPNLMPLALTRHTEQEYINFVCHDFLCLLSTFTQSPFSMAEGYKNTLQGVTLFEMTLSNI